MTRTSYAPDVGDAPRIASNAWALAALPLRVPRHVASAAAGATHGLRQQARGAWRACLLRRRRTCVAHSAAGRAPLAQSASPQCVRLVKNESGLRCSAPRTIIRSHLSPVPPLCAQQAQAGAARAGVHAEHYAPPAAARSAARQRTAAAGRRQALAAPACCAVFRGVSDLLNGWNSANGASVKRPREAHTPSRHCQAAHDRTRQTIIVLSSTESAR